MRKPGGPLGAVSLCFISTNAAGMQGTEGFPRGHRAHSPPTSVYIYMYIYTSV